MALENRSPFFSYVLRDWRRLVYMVGKDTRLSALSESFRMSETIENVKWLFLEIFDPIIIVQMK